VEICFVIGFPHKTISRVYKEWCEKGKTSSMRQSCWQKCLVDARGQRRMGRLIQADRRATLTEITTRYNQGMQESICEIHNLEADGLQQQKTPPGTTHLHYK